MKEKITNFVSALLIYFIGGLLVSYVGMPEINWNFVIGSTLVMTLFDFFILSRLRKQLKNKQLSKYNSHER